MALIDVDYFRRQPYGKSFDKLNTDLLEETIQEASEYVEDYLDRKILAGTYYERIIGRQNWVIILDQYPVTGLVSVSFERANGEVGTFSNSQFLIHGDAGMIEMIDKSDWFRSDTMYVITYTAGYEEVPGPIKRATALQTIQLLRPMFSQEFAELPELVADDLITNLLEKARRKRIA